MEIQIEIQWKYFLWSVAAGMCLALIYDLLRVSRRALHTRDFLVNLEDILFFVITGVILFLTAYFKNGGLLRWHGFIGALLGFAVYKLTIGDYVLRTLLWILRLIKRFLVFLLKIAFFPFRLVVRIFRRPAGVVVWYTKKGARRAKNTVKSQCRRVGTRVKNTVHAIKKK